MSKEQKSEDRQTFGDYPPPISTTVIHKLWNKHMGPYDKGWGHVRPNKERVAEMMKRMRPMMDAIKRHDDLRKNVG